MVQYLIRNSLKVENYYPCNCRWYQLPYWNICSANASGKRGLVNSLLYDGSDFSDWGAMYAEVTMNFPHLRGFDKYESREAGVFDGVTQRVEKVDIPATNIPWDVDKIVIRNTNNDVIKAVNELLAKDKLVQMTYSDGETFNKGDFVVAKRFRYYQK